MIWAENGTSWLVSHGSAPVATTTATADAAPAAIARAANQYVRMTPRPRSRREDVAAATATMAVR